MEFLVKSGSIEKQRTAALVVGVYETRKLSPSAEKIDAITDGYLSNIVKRGDMEGKHGQMLLLHNVPNAACERVLLVGCGKERELTDARYAKLLAAAVRKLHDTGSTEAISCLAELNVKGRDLAWKIRSSVEQTEQALYTFDELKSKKDSTRKPLRRITFNVSTRKDLVVGEQAIEQGQAIAVGRNKARDLANLPGNICNPTYLAIEAKKLVKQYDKVSCRVLDESELESMGAGAFVSVSKGSEQPGKLITLHYKGAPNGDKPVVLVGKGITFDTGGISLKPGAGMDEMKFDMGGAASVFGTFVSVCELGLPINLVVVIAAAENMPSGRATRPGDVVTSLSGQTIEILNTDAEGRLVLCDALTFVERYDPDVVIDVATLTGAVIIALGHEATGLMSNHNPLAHELENAGEQTGDRIWRLPIWEEYHDSLKSNFADFTNLGGRAAGTITAACFLAKFTRKYQWAHLDIAGTAWVSGKQKGATGRPVPLLTQFIMDRAARKADK